MMSGENVDGGAVGDAPVDAVHEWIDSALATAAGDGASDGLAGERGDGPGDQQGITVLVQESHEVNLRWANNALTTNGAMTSRTATVIATGPVAQGGGTGSASITGPLTGAHDLPDLITRANHALAQAPADPEAQPLVTPEQAHLAGTEDFTAAADRVGPETFATLAADLGAAFDVAREAGHLLFGFAEYRRTTTWLANSTGLRRRSVEPMGRMEVNAKAPDLINSAWVGQSSNDFTDVDVAALHEELQRRLAWGERRVDLEPGSYETILPPGAVVDLLVYAYWMMSARDAEDGRTVFAGSEVGTSRIGERLTDLPISVASDPAHPEVYVAPFVALPSSQPGAASVFDNGAAVQATRWIEDGVLTNLVRTRAGAARRPDSRFAYPAENLIIEAGGSGSVEDLIAGTTRGLLLTCLWYIREVDPQTLLLTGLTRDGVYLIEDGKVTAAVNNFRFNESPISLLRRATEASGAQRVLCREWNDWFTRSVAPALRIPDFTMSTVSQAH